MSNIFYNISPGNFSIVPFIPEPRVVLENTTLTAEGCTPGNERPDPNETVTMNFALRNAGTGDSGEVVATLLASEAILPLSGSQTYGPLAAGGSSTMRPFTVTLPERTRRAT